ncbi:sigma-70 family RNA polymerase sigma factor [Paenibacillus sp. 7124]|uniref:Sigma-70 family RNA polymerase sigma factor n=1 Tax=Paenibacillus apii TaxID=1850370 RepID=A0A6M1PDB7_9BACL|nr:sigma-70 family RNA polymerase sigma factor [Paenibacillus apii]NGM81270.1 sigma-70 family RNA polymerase sigma factor [Paenibacillus apii]
MNVYPDNPLLGPRSEFITANLGLAHKAAQRFRGACYATNTPLDDIISEGYVGLIRAYDGYSDPTYEFATYATETINGYMRNYFRRGTGPVRIPKEITPIVNRLARAGLEGEAPETVAQELGISVRLAEKALYCATVRNCGDMPADDKRGNTDDYSGVFADAFLARLRPKPRRIVRLLTEGYTQTEAAKAIGITSQAVSQTVKRVRAEYERYERIPA